MSVTPVLDATGLTVLRTEDVRTNLAEAVQSSSQFGPDTPVGPDSLVGQIIDATSQQIGLTYELMQAVYDAGDPSAAAGVVLDAIADARGLTREPSTASTVTLTLGGVAATVIAAGSRVRVDGGPIFALDAAATIGGGGTVSAEATCSETGSSEAVAGTVTTIVDAVAGWTSATNPADAAIGSAEETDAALWLRIRDSRSILGNGTVPAIRSRVAALATVDYAVVLTNRTLVTDANGLPGKSYRVLVWPDDLTSAEEDELAEAIWNAGEPAGIYCDGTETRTVTDEQGNSETIRWSYATDVRTYWDLTLEIDTDPGVDAYPVDGDDLVAAAIVAYGATLGVGRDVLPVRAAGYVVNGYTDDSGTVIPGVPGIRTVTLLVDRTSSPATGTPVVIAATEISTTALADVAVTSA
jgi:hypothetical protein